MSNGGSSRRDDGKGLERARSLQLSMLPRTPNIESLEIACSYSACEYLGGDFYDFILVDSWRLGIVIADVSGHGTAAALLMAAGKKVIQMCARGNLSPRQTLLEVNDSLRADIPAGMFLSMLYGVIDIRNHRFCFASCGHNQPILCRGGAVKSAWSHDNAPVLGVLPSSELKGHLKEEFVQLQADDVLAFYTDGITEAFNAQKQMFTEARLEARLAAMSASAPAFIVDAIHDDVQQFRGAVEQSDDETLVVVKVGAPAPKIAPMVPTTPSSEDSLPSWQSPLLGREAAIDELVRRLRELDHPVVMLSGPAGVGKTRLAVAAAEGAHARFLGGTHFVDLRRALSVADVCRQVATVLRLPEDAANLGTRVALALKGMPEPLLLILDGCENCADAVRKCIEEWRARAPGLRVLVTTRVAVDMPGSSINVQPLPHPQPGEALGSVDEALARYPSIELFARIATTSSPDFKLTADNLNEIGRICSRLDGLPQAIELIASRIGTLSTQQILKRLNKRSGLVRAGDEHGRSALHGTLSMSWDLLSQNEKSALMVLSLFPAGFQLDVATEALAVLSGAPADALIRGLLKHSLLRYDTPDGIDGERRFYVYESARLFAAEKLHASELEPEARLSFDRAVVRYVRHWHEQARGRQRKQSRRRLGLEVETLSAVARGTSDPECRAWVSVILAPMLYERGEPDRAMELLRGALADLPSTSEAWPWVYVTDGGLRVREAPQYVEEMLRSIKGDVDVVFAAVSTRAVALQLMAKFDEAVAILDEFSKQPGLSVRHRAALKERLGRVFSHSGRTAEARALLEGSISQALSEGNESLAAQARFQLAWLNARSHRVAEAVSDMREVLKFAEEDGDRPLESRALGELALSHHLLGERQESEACFRRGIRIARELGLSTVEAAQLNTLTRIYHEQGRNEDALKAAIKARDLARECGALKSEALAEGNIASLRMNMGDGTVAMESWERVHSMLTKVGDKRTALVAKSNIGAAYGERWKKTKDPRDLQRAVQTLTEALEERRQAGYDQLVAAEFLLAEILAMSNRKPEAMVWLDRTIAASGRVNDAHSESYIAKASALRDELLSRRKGKRATTSKLPPRPSRAATGPLTKPAPIPPAVAKPQPPPPAKARPASRPQQPSLQKPVSKPAEGVIPAPPPAPKPEAKPLPGKPLGTPRPRATKGAAPRRRPRRP